jgi:hypothetical protein
VYSPLHQDTVKGFVGDTIRLKTDTVRRFLGTNANMILC